MTATATRPAAGPPWDWRTFPVLFAFVIGALVMALLIAAAPGAFPVLLVGALFAVAFGAAHVLARRLVRRRKQ